MDEIFSETKEEPEKEGDSNIEWKKSGIDKHERLTLKINIKEANMYNASKENDFKVKHKAKTPLEVPKGFKKIKTRIRDSMDEEDEDEEEGYIFVPVFEDINESSLMRALTPEEKLILEQNENINNVRLQENIGKEAAIEHAEKVIMQAGIERPDQKVLDEQRLKAGKVSEEEIVLKTAKTKPLSKTQKATDENLRKEDEKALNKAQKAPKESRDSAKTAVAKVKKAEALAEEKANKEALKKEEQNIKLQSEEETKPTETDTAGTNAEPENKRAEEEKEVELTSVKAEEKAPVEQPEVEIVDAKEEAQKQELAESKEEVTQDKINEEKAPQAEDKPQEKAMETDARQEEVNDLNDKMTQAEKETEKEDREKEIREIIKEKSGRTHAEEQKAQEPKTAEQEKELSDNEEYRKIIEEQLKKYQERYR